MERGGQPGNQSAVKGKRWQQAIMRALARATNQDVDTGLDRAADRLVTLALEGDKWALDHLADRIEGKAAQGIVVSGDAEAPIKHTVELIGASAAPRETETPL